MTDSSKVTSLSWTEGDFLWSGGLVHVMLGDLGEPFSFVGLGHWLVVAIVLTVTGVSMFLRFASSCSFPGGALIISMLRLRFEVWAFRRIRLPTTTRSAIQ